MISDKQIHNTIILSFYDRSILTTVTFLCMLSEGHVAVLNDESRFGTVD